MIKNTPYPRVGVAVLILNDQGQILVGKRKNSHGASSWAPPGGHLEFSETFEACAVRETLEETGLKIEDPLFLGITNDKFPEENKHFVTVFMKAELQNKQAPKCMEPHKCEGWQWFTQDKLPEILFTPFKKFIQGKVYTSSPFLYSFERHQKTYFF